MPSIKDLYRPALLSAKSLAKKRIIGKIEAAYPESVKGTDKDSRTKVVIELDKGKVRIALNKTNALALAESFGDDYSLWVGKKIVVSTGPTTYMGNPTDGIIVRPTK